MDDAEANRALIALYKLKHRRQLRDIDADIDRVQAADLIRRARLSGASVDRCARALGISRPAVYALVERVQRDHEGPKLESDHEGLRPENERT